MKVFETVHQICEERKIPISELEKRAGIANGIVYKWGKGASPNMKSLMAIAAALEVDINTLLAE